MRVTIPRPSLPFVIAFVACGGTTDSGVTIVDSAGVTIVTSPGEDRLLPWHFTEVRRLGGEDTGAQSFTNTATAYVGADAKGRIFVLDADAKRVAVFDTGGATLRLMGREGGGPGELLFPGLLNVLPDGTVEVSDYSKGGLVRFGPEGEVLPEVSFARTGWGEGRSFGIRDTLMVLRSATEGQEQVTRLLVETPADTTELLALRARTAGLVQFSCVGLNIPPLFTPDLRMTARGRTMLATRTLPYVVEVFDGARLVRSIRRDVPALPADRKAVARLHPAGMRLRSFGSGATGVCTISADELYEKLGVAGEVPPIRDVMLAPDGTVWVERATFPDEPTRVDVFDAEGHYLGTHTGMGPPLGFSGDLVLFRDEDEATGVQQVVLWRVSR